MSDFYDTQGRPIGIETWMRLIEERRTGEVHGNCAEDRWWIVGKTLLGDVEVSTVWLGIDHNWSATGPPLIFETMVFGGGPLSYEMNRYSTWEQAERGHHDMVERVRAAEREEQ